MVEEMGGCRRLGGSGVGTSRGESLGGESRDEEEKILNDR
jgi:hypothetical protein